MILGEVVKLETTFEVGLGPKFISLLQKSLIDTISNNDNRYQNVIIMFDEDNLSHDSMKGTLIFAKYRTYIEYYNTKSLAQLELKFEPTHNFTINKYYKDDEEPFFLIDITLSDANMVKFNPKYLNVVNLKILLLFDEWLGPFYLVENPDYDNEYEVISLKSKYDTFRIHYTSFRFDDDEREVKFSVFKNSAEFIVVYSYKRVNEQIKVSQIVSIGMRKSNREINKIISADIQDNIDIIAFDSMMSDIGANPQPILTKILSIAELVNFGKGFLLHER